MTDAIDKGALEIGADLRRHALPTWYRMGRAAHGYRPGDVSPLLRSRLLRLRHRPLDLAGWSSRNLVFQSRLLWTFALAHRLGYGSADHDYRRAAEHGYRFLTGHMLDERHGGYVWQTDSRGRVTDPRKTLYGQAFALFALVEYHRALGIEEPLARASALFDIVQEKMADGANSGWIEHFSADFKPLAPCRLDGSCGLLDVVGLKSANAYLHWMEALAELVRVTGREPHRAALDEAIRLNTTHFFPADPGQVRTLVSPDWRPAGDASSDLLYYGHLLEFAWLLVRAQQALGVTPEWERLNAAVELVLRYGFDHELGGVYWYGPRSGSATNHDKTWWVQAEALVALTMSLKHDPHEERARALELHLRWILQHQRRRNGIWSTRCDRLGNPRPLVSTQSWRAGYHEVRAMAEFVRIWAGSQSAVPSDACDASSR